MDGRDVESLVRMPQGECEGPGIGGPRGMTYPGGKNGSGVYQQIINQMPPHACYIEPFLGGGAVMRRKRPAAVNIGVDLDAGAVRQIRRGRPTSPSSLLAWHFERGDGIRFLREFEFTGNELVYCDPPYMLETRTRELYEHEMTDAQHRELLKVIKRLACPVMISGYWTPLYARELQSWRRLIFQTTNRGGKRTAEFLWMNFPEPVELHDYQYIGANWRERERIKRKKLRWTARLKRMPVLERQALLAAIADTGGNGGTRVPPERARP